MLQEFSFALRRLRKSPGFTVLAFLTLTLGIGVTTAVFTLVDSVILQPLAYRNSGQLVVAWERVKFLGPSFHYTGPSPRHAEIWQQRATTFSSLSLARHGATGFTLGHEHPRLTGVLIATPNLLDTLGIAPVLGRSLRQDDAVKGRDKVALITFDLWRSAFSSHPDVIGKTIRLSDTPLTVVGVLPPQFQFPSVFGASRSRNTTIATQVLTPAVINHDHGFGWNSDYGNWTAIGRLKPGVTVRQAQAQLDSLQQEIVREMPPSQRDDSPNSLLAYVQPLQEAVVGESRKGLWLLLAAVGGLMLIACVNLANAQLGRAISRERETAVRSALGASQGQLLHSPLAESLLLAVGGGATGLLFATQILDLFQRLTPVALPRMAEIHINGPVLIFAALLTLASAVLFGLAPTLKLLTVDPQAALQQNNNRSAGSRGSSQARYWLIGVQVFACTALLLVTGLLTSSLWHLLTGDKGFSSAQVTAAQVELQNAGNAEDFRRLAFDDAVLDKLRSLPGIDSAALLSAMPLEGESWIDGMEVAGTHSKTPPLANWRWVSPGYFETIREKLIAGRSFKERDRNLNSIILSQAAARAAFGSQSALGKHINHNGAVYTVIGEVADARNNSLKQPPANMAYLHYKDNPPYHSFFLVRSTLPISQLANQMRAAIWTEDPAATVARIKTLDSQVNDSLAPERFQTVVLLSFGFSALLLAMLGIYGVLSYAVANRTREIGVRMALGANRKSIYSLTVAEAASPVLIGLATGWAASLVAGRFIGSFLYGVKPSDPLVTGTVFSLFLAAAILAAYLPARRAASVDPMQALRTD